MSTPESYTNNEQKSQPRSSLHQHPLLTCSSPGDEHPSKYYQLLTTLLLITGHLLFQSPIIRPWLFINMAHINMAHINGDKPKYPVAFAFDIDGVLVKGKTALPGAKKTIELLQHLNVPFIFLTNGGGHNEAEHEKRIAARLGLASLRHGQLVQSHSPYHDLVTNYRDETVLVLGGHGDQIRNLAHDYGFRKVVTSSDVVAKDEHIHPFPEMTGAHHALHGRSAVPGDGESPDDTRIAAILVWSSPRDWCLDLQLVCDLLLSSRGVLGTRSPRNGDASLPNHGFQRDEQPVLYFCNPDFEWATEHRQPRFAQGAFREALKGIWRHATAGKAELEYSVVGKPTETTYVYAEKVLRGLTLSPGEIGTVYMVGDNPASDIVGANSFRSKYGSVWKSVLVETGVFVPGSFPAHTPTKIARDVAHAVTWALAEEGILHRQEKGETKEE
ncbi:HAD-superfamily hydrolase [Sodiomyces alkalinus F11]|uniref:HAD-superfamily hydrolase n=1 Tax=Sodiomyces alkalinus (strain CBS 110278 / VKM F-3762 / F11) TaxID=1314773 RepID=A0A3N2Q660_SODAK|nr:HAD-superfamily hydrolase [Sodiomyces alkalinus F11]ROT42187.1 HAD-superfamily hydrolase [Sodiomyces alkalinus F11]